MTAAIRAIFQWWGRALEWWRTFRANQSEALEPLLVTNDPQAATKCQRRQVIRFTPWAVRQVREVLNHHPTACVRANILGDNATGFRYEMKLDEASGMVTWSTTRTDFTW